MAVLKSVMLLLRAIPVFLGPTVVSNKPVAYEVQVQMIRKEEKKK